MNDRKAYVSPAVLSEDVLEQTSLACNATAPVSTYVPGTGNFGPGADDGGDCKINVAKNNAFASDTLCQTLVESEGQVVALS